jgi:hypothetical protein
MSAKKVSSFRLESVDFFGSGRQKSVEPIFCDGQMGSKKSTDSSRKLLIFFGPSQKIVSTPFCHSARKNNEKLSRNNGSKIAYFAPDFRGPLLGKKNHFPAKMKNFLRDCSTRKKMTMFTYGVYQNYGTPVPTFSLPCFQHFCHTPYDSPFPLFSRLSMFWTSRDHPHSSFSLGVPEF